MHEPGATQMPEHAPADTTVTRNPDGTLNAVVNVRLGDERAAEHEVGHLHDARTNEDQFFKDALSDQKKAGGPFELPHDDRPVEKRANQFRNQVEKERKEFRREQRVKGDPQ